MEFHGNIRRLRKPFEVCFADWRSRVMRSKTSPAVAVVGELFEQSSMGDATCDARGREQPPCTIPTPTRACSFM